MSFISVVEGASLDWPSEGDLESHFKTIQCAGLAALDFFDLPQSAEEFHETEKQIEEEENEEDEANGGAVGGDPSAAANAAAGSAFQINLLELTPQELEALNYYQVLHLPFSPTLTPEQIRKAYLKASVKYHPDKTQKSEDEDPVFLKVKAAYETLSTNKQAYDSTEMPFDESIPSGNESPQEFYREYSLAFERNLHFDARLLQSNNAKHHRANHKKKKKGHHASTAPPRLGDESTSIEDVHRFYDYWTHFITWRDFTLQAAKELDTQDHLEQAESRFEKRWYQKEIDRLAKKLKQKEQSRITSLVERAMAADPRLKAEKARLLQEKQERQRQREQEAAEKKRLEEEQRLQEEKRLEEEKQQKAEEKLAREKEKKQLRKAKQAFRKSVTEALLATSQSEFALEEKVEVICTQLDRTSLTELTSSLSSISEPKKVLEKVLQHADSLHEENGATENGNGAGNGKGTSAGGATVVTIVSEKKEKTPFTKEEMSALAKAVKKYPPGGANRWDQIALYINNVCKPQDPKTKEECIETFNRIAKGGKAPAAGPLPSSNQSEPPKEASKDGDTWTEEQDKLLQDGLKKYPASMDKNERWSSIAGDIPGKTKKECVQRFKAIRDAIKNKK